MLLRHSAALLAVAAMAFAQPPGGTTLSQPAARFTRSDKPYAILKRGPIEIVVVTNDAVDDTVLPSHRAGYSGVAVLRHKHRAENLFVPGIAGLNFEHILDGTAHADRKTQFEPRNWPMELRLINRHAVELCQTPTFYHALESCQRYELLRDGTIQLTIEVSARKASFRRGYVGLFWASYIHKPESLDIHFRGAPAAQPDPRQSRWIRGVTPAHGVLSTHPALDDSRVFPHDEPFPLTLVHSLSEYRYTEPWYFGVSRGMAFVQMFRPKDRVRITQSPSGGGQGNPAWDFQFYVPDYEPDRVYQFVMRAAYLPFQSPEQIERVTRKHRAALAR
ncbi:MAG TPA: hypothetical protein VFB63_14605 [Bryobacteraceae bacterium]|nr:hypothetical protein [Bryobacteraceae bacterium]